jgi:hypothetical protein
MIKNRFHWTELKIYRQRTRFLKVNKLFSDTLYPHSATCFILVSYFAYSSSLKMEATCSYESSSDFQHGVISQKISLAKFCQLCQISKPKAGNTCPLPVILSARHEVQQVSYELRNWLYSTIMRVLVSSQTFRFSRQTYEQAKCLFRKSICNRSYHNEHDFFVAEESCGWNKQINENKRATHLAYSENICTITGHPSFHIVKIHVCCNIVFLWPDLPTDHPGVISSWRGRRSLQLSRPILHGSLPFCSRTISIWVCQTHRI